AAVMQQTASHAKDFVVGVDGDCHIPILIALLCRTEEVLVPILDPFHRPAEFQGYRRNHRLLWIEDRLWAEAAADLGRDHADRFDSRSRRSASMRRPICGVCVLDHTVSTSE